MRAWLSLVQQTGVWVEADWRMGLRKKAAAGHVGDRQAGDRQAGSGEVDTVQGQTGLVQVGCRQAGSEEVSTVQAAVGQVGSGLGQLTASVSC